MNDTYALLLLAVAFALILYLWQRSDDEFDLRHLIVDSATSRVSLFKLGQFIALIVSTWALVHETRRGFLTEWLFAMYMIAWAGANIANKVTEKYKSLEPPKEDVK
jgi:hypothetical protein